jgi:hypothetical protein
LSIIFQRANESIQQRNMRGETLGSSYILYCWPDCYRPSWFSSVSRQVLRWFQISQLLLHASHAALSVESNQNPAALSQAATSNHPNVFTFILPLSEGRVGEAREPSNKPMFSPPPHYKLSLFSHDFPCHLRVYYDSLRVSLSLGI